MGLENIPINLSSSQTSESHAGRVSPREGLEPNNVAYVVKRKKREKNLTVLHAQHRTPPITIPISTKGKEWEHEKKEVPHWKKVGKS